jgi:serine/threonine protein kinase
MSANPVSNSEYVVNYKNFKEMRYVTNINHLYDIKNELGEGSYSKVKLANRRFTNTECALKIIPKDTLTDQTHQSIFI